MGCPPTFPIFAAAARLFQATFFRQLDFFSHFRFRFLAQRVRRRRRGQLGIVGAGAGSGAERGAAGHPGACGAGALEGAEEDDKGKRHQQRGHGIDQLGGVVRLKQLIIVS